MKIIPTVILSVYENTRVVHFVYPDYNFIRCFDNSPLRGYNFRVPIDNDKIQETRS